MQSKDIFQRLNSNIIAARFKQKQQCDKKVHFKPYNPGDVVYLNVQLSGKGQKLSNLKFDGSYRVLARVNEVNYEIKKIDGQSRVITVHHS